MVACPKALIDIISVISVVTLHRNLPEQQRPGLTKLWPGSDICCVAVKAVRTVEGRHTREPSCLTSGAKIIFSFDHLLKMENQSGKPPHVGEKPRIILSVQISGNSFQIRSTCPVLGYSETTSKLLWFMVLWFYCLVLLLIYCCVSGHSLFTQVWILSHCCCWEGLYSPVHIDVAHF